MAFASVGSLGTAQEKTSDTDLVLTVTATAEAGNLVAVFVAMDNLGTSDAETTQLSIADSAGNTWTKLREQTESSGVAADGLTGAIFVSVLTSQLASGAGTITVTSSASVTAKAMEAWEFTLAESSVSLGDGTSVAVQNLASGQPTAVTVSGMTSREYLLLHLYVREATTSTFTPGTSYTSMTGIGTSGGAGDTNVSVWGAYRIATLTTDNPDATAGTGAQGLQILAAIYEVAGGGGGGPTIKSLSALGVG